MSPRFDEVRRLADLEKKTCSAWKIVSRELETQVIAGNEEIFDDGSAHSEYYSNFGIDDPNINLAVDLRNASPWLLEVAGCFQLGYAARLSKLYMLIDMYHPDNDDDLEMIEYLLKAAKIMEERE